MIQTAFESDVLPADERLAQFDAVQVAGVSPMQVQAPCPMQFRATVRALDLGVAEVAEVSCSASEIRRTPRLIRRQDPDLQAIVFPVRGGLELSHRGRHASLEPGQFAFYDSSHPMQVRIQDDTTLIRAHVPTARLPIHRSRLDLLLGERLSGGAGLGGLLTQTLTRFMTDGTTYRATDVPRLGSLVVDLLTATLAHELESAGELPDDSRQRTLMLGIDSFVQQHLGDPDLSPATIAAAHHISVSYLHRLFRARGVTVAASIRQRRLEQACRDLADPTLLPIPVHRIAARWGFADHATFTRAFRAAYDVSPRDYRELAAARLAA